MKQDILHTHFYKFYQCHLRPVGYFSFQIGTDPREARYWLRQFQQHESTPDQPFAVVQVDSPILNDKVMVSWNSLWQLVAFNGIMLYNFCKVIVYLIHSFISLFSLVRKAGLMFGIPAPQWYACDHSSWLGSSFRYSNQGSQAKKG